MNNDVDQPDVPDTKADVAREARAVDASRRLFTKTGLIAAPIIMSLSSRSALANSQCTISGLLSGNLSQQGGGKQCAGLTPGYWGQHPNDWPAPYSPGTPKDTKKGKGGGASGAHDYNADGTLFLSVFAGPATFSGLSMMQVIQLIGDPKTADAYQLGAHACAALLNATKYQNDPNYEFGLTPTQVITLYNSNYLSNPEGIKQVFQMWNENNRDPNLLQTLLGP